MANLLTFQGHGGGPQKKFPFHKLQKRRFWNQQKHTQKLTSKQTPALTPRTAGQGKGSEQSAALTCLGEGSRLTLLLHPELLPLA